MKPSIEFIIPAKLTSEELEVCLAILEEGQAVDVDSARKELPLAVQIVVHRDAGKIVALGAEKRQRPPYATRIAASDKANYAFDPSLNEIGYIAVRESHKGKKLSSLILDALLANTGTRPLFATTFHERMKYSLPKRGFINHGKEWQNPKGDCLSLWIKTNK